MILNVPIPAQGSVPLTLVTIESLSTDVKLRTDVLALETDPVPAPDIEFVIVTNP